MTAANVWISESGHAGMVLVDSAGFDGPTGNFVCNMNKSTLVAHSGAIIVGCGVAAACQGFIAALAVFATFDEVLSKGKECMRGMHAIVTEKLGDVGDIDIIVCGWSEAQQRVLAAGATNPDFEWEMRNRIVYPVVDISGITGSAQTWLLDVMERQRRDYRYDCVPGGVGIGGKAILSCVSRGGL